MKISDVVTIQQLQDIVSEIAYDKRLPEPDASIYRDEQRQCDVIRLFIRHNTLKFSNKIAISDSSFDFDVIISQLQTATDEIKESIKQSEVSVTYRGNMYLLSWRQQDYFELECPHCHATECLPFKNYSVTGHSRDVAICYMVGNIECTCDRKT